MVSAQPTPADRMAAPDPDANAEGSRCLLRHHRERRGASESASRRQLCMAEVARSESSPGQDDLGAILPSARTLPASASAGCPLGVPEARSKTICLRSRMPELGTSGSVGAPGERFPGATRPSTDPATCSQCGTGMPSSRRTRWRPGRAACPRTSAAGIASISTTAPAARSSGWAHAPSRTTRWATWWRSATGSATPSHATATTPAGGGPCALHGTGRGSMCTTCAVGSRSASGWTVSARCHGRSRMTATGSRRWRSWTRRSTHPRKARAPGWPR